MLIKRTSPFTGKVHIFDLPVTEAQMAVFGQRVRPMVQDIFPDLAPEWREFIKTGITPEEWDNAFGKED